MLRSIMILAAVAATTVALSASAHAGPKHRMAIYDGETGNKIYDDGKLDGKGCVIGKKVVYDKFTGQLIVVPAIKCVGF